VPAVTDVCRRQAAHSQVNALVFSSHPFVPPQPGATAPEPTIIGTAAGSETINGTAGADVLATGGGLWDKLAGGAANDAYIVEINQTTVAEAYGGGDDTVYSYADFLTVASEVEHFVLLAGAGSVSANRYDNTILGNAGANSLSSQAGNDSIDGGLDTDTAVFSGDYADYLIVENADGSLTVTDTVGTDGVDTLVNIELLAFADGTFTVSETLSGSSPPPPPPPPGATAPEPTIIGTNAGGETINGTAGADVLATGGGLWDKLAGGSGNDAYIVEINQTTVAEAYGGGDDTVYSYADFLTVASEVEHFVLLAGAGSVSVNRYDNTILGNVGANSLSSQAGNDSIEGGLDTDTAVFSGDYADYLIVENGDGSLTVTDTVGTDGVDTLVNIELLGFADQTIDVATLIV
jgi:serralysin